MGRSNFSKVIDSKNNGIRRNFGFSTLGELLQTTGLSITTLVHDSTPPLSLLHAREHEKV